MKTESDIYPFSQLPKNIQKELTPYFSYEKIDKGTTLFEQDITMIESIYILIKGKANYFYDTGASKILTGELNNGDNFGGLSILFNESIAIRSLAIEENASFLILPANNFLKIIKKNELFQNYFTNEFGKCMLNKSFAGIINRQYKDKQFNLPFFNRPIRSVFRPMVITCQTNDTIESACQKMSRHDIGAILIKQGKRNVIGIVTDADLKNKILAKEVNGSQAVSTVMSSPVVSISADGQIFEAFLAIVDHDKRHIAVHNQSGDITGILSEKDLITAQTESTYLLIKRVKKAKSILDLENIHSKLENMLLGTLKNGANPDYITHLIAAFSDAIIDKVISFSLDKLGPTPCKFVFLTMGSEGREEQTLISDQDNAIVYEDTDHLEKAKDYFFKLATLICDQLDMAGYRFCEGNNMAKNPKWCQPISVWKEYFNTWIRSSTPERLLHSSIFFDFRGTWGHMPLSDELNRYLFNAINQWPGFLRNLTENTLHFRPPISMFGKLLLETKGEKKGALDIKISMLPIVDFARIYALKNGISQTNTLTRLFRLYTLNAISGKEYTDIVRSYNYLMNLRFLRQITTIFDEQKKPDNYIYPQNLSFLDKILLKEIFKMIEKLQQKLSFEFTGSI